MYTITSLTVERPIFGDSKQSIHVSRDRCEMLETTIGILIRRRPLRDSEPIQSVVVPWTNIVYYHIDEHDDEQAKRPAVKRAG